MNPHCITLQQVKGLRSTFWTDGAELACSAEVPLWVVFKTHEEVCARTVVRIAHRRHSPFVSRCGLVRWAASCAKRTRHQDAHVIETVPLLPNWFSASSNRTFPFSLRHDLPVWPQSLQCALDAIESANCAALMPSARLQRLAAAPFPFGPGTDWVPISDIVYLRCSSLLRTNPPRPRPGSGFFSSI